MLEPAAVICVHVTTGLPPAMAMEGLVADAPPDVRPFPVALPATACQVPPTSCATYRPTTPLLDCVQASHGPAASAAMAGEDALPAVDPSAMPVGPASALHQPCGTGSLGSATLGAEAIAVGKDNESPDAVETGNSRSAA